MKVITLEIADFAEVCKRLFKLVMDSDFVPDIIVGIRTGGEFVALNMWSALHAGDLPEGVLPSPAVAMVELHRPATSMKQGFKGFLSHMPRWLLNGVRMLESIALRLRKISPEDIAARKAMLSESLPPTLKCLKKRKVLIVDDAVDSGATMLAVAEALREANPEAEIRTAAITVTTPKPLITPDYSMYKDLIRFPWSMDAKKVK